MIFATSTPLIAGLKGRSTKEGQKKMLIYRRVKPVYVGIRMVKLRQHLLPTGTSTTFNTALVFLSPSKSSQPMRKKKSIIMQATDAGNETVLKLIKEWMPKQANRITMIPAGT